MLTWGVWQTQGGNTGASLDQERVGVTVVAANKLDDLQASSQQQLAVQADTVELTWPQDMRSGSLPCCNSVPSHVKEHAKSQRVELLHLQE
jgi:hypothetical protein